ncbi:MAG: hypothetical protein V3S29_02605 [bacterium]
MLRLECGWFFERTEDGGVRGFRTEDGEPDGSVAEEFECDEFAWASLVIHVSGGDEKSDAYYGALQFHREGA